MNKKTVRDIDLKDKKVFLRCDFNVPMDENKNITDNRRIISSIPTIKYLLDNNCAVILASHLGRPKGEVNPDFSLAPVAKELSKQLGKEVVSIWGSKDGVIKFENLIESKDKLPEDTTYVEIEGANHAQFGDYGKQKGDYDALISEEKQLNITLNSIVKLLKNIDNN